MSAEPLVNDATDVLHLSAEVRDVWTTLSSEVPVYHFSRQTFAEMESCSDIPINAELFKKKPVALAIAIDDVAPDDGEHPPESRTELLLLDGRTQEWYFFERSRIEHPLAIARGQVIGAVWPLQGRWYTSLPSHDFAYYRSADIQPWRASQEHTERLIRTVLTFFWVTSHDEVTVSAPLEINGQKHYLVSLPDGLSVNGAVADLLDGRHVHKPPSRTRVLLRSFFNMLHRWLPKASHSSP